MFRKNTSKGGVTPLRNQPVEKWQNWLESAHWREVFNAFQDFIPRGYTPYKEHDKQVMDLLSSRLFRIEFPVSKLPFGVNLLRVDNEIENLDLKALVKVTKKQYPYVIVEKNGRYRGIALTPDFILAGVCWFSAMPKTVIKRARELKLEFLTREDSKVVEQYFNEVDELLEVVGAPTISDLRCWLVAPVASHAPYEVWQLSRRDRKGYIGEKTPTYMLAKL